MMCVKGSSLSRNLEIFGVDQVQQYIWNFKKVYSNIGTHLKHFDITHLERIDVLFNSPPWLQIVTSILRIFNSCIGNR